MSTYYGTLTPIGKAKQANAMSLGKSIIITQLGVGDGNGQAVTPDQIMAGQAGEWRREAINQLYVDPGNPNYLIAEQVIPEDEGGKWIRAWTLYDDAGDLVAVANCPPTYKPLLSEGSGRTQVIRMVIMVDSTAAFQLKIDPSVVLATRKYVDDGLANLDAANLKKGIVPVVRGGTGLAVVPNGKILIGSADASGPMQVIDMATLYDMLGIADILKNYAREYSIMELPTQDVGSIIVTEADEIWRWVSTPYFDGYRSSDCGQAIFGATLTPRSREVDGTGGLLPKTAPYLGLLAFAKENGLVVDQATWTANLGAHWFVDVDANTFRVPDLRQQFASWRMGAPDPDTANARTLGSYKADTMQGHWHGLKSYSNTATGTGSQPFLDDNPTPVNLTYSVASDARSDGIHGTPRVGMETAPRHTAYAARIHI
jgi:hypothetical protein